MSDSAAPDASPYCELVDVNHPRALLMAWGAEIGRLEELLNDHGHLDGRGQPADVPTAVLLTRVRVLEEVHGQLQRRLQWSGMLDP